MPLFDAGMRLRCLVELVNLFDDDLEPRLGDRAAQSLEWCSSSDCIVRDHSNFGSFAGLGLDPVRICDAAVGHELIDAFLEVIAAGEGKNGVQSIGRE
jgi:hypothetical protein